MAPPDRVLLSCEHGGNAVPPAYADLFAGAEATLASHRGYDIGALAAARHLQKRLGVPLVAATTTRLLVDLNRSPGHPRLFSAFSRRLAAAEREEVLARHYRPYRERVTHWLLRRAAPGAPALHVSVHTFAAVLDGRHRRCDVGLLYDPSRELEAAFCSEWQARLVEAVPGLVVRRNYPYRGIADGLVTWLRRRLPANDYLGIELELNQALSVRRGAAWRRLLDALAVTLPVDWLSGHRGAGAVRGRGRRRPAGRPR